MAPAASIGARSVPPKDCGRGGKDQVTWSLQATRPSLPETSIAQGQCRMPPMALEEKLSSPHNCRQIGPTRGGWSCWQLQEHGREDVQACPKCAKGT